MAHNLPSLASFHSIGVCKSWKSCVAPPKRAFRNAGVVAPCICLKLAPPNGALISSRSLKFNEPIGTLYQLPQSIPFIPADRFLLGFKLHTNHWGDFYHPYFGANTRIVLAQNQPGPPGNQIDTPTGGYTVFGLSFGWRILVEQNPLSFDFGADNLLNKAYADSMSVYDKQFGFVEPGRNLYMKVSVPFGS